MLWEGLRTLMPIVISGGLVAFIHITEQLIFVEFTVPGNFHHLAVAQTLIFCGLVIVTIAIGLAFSRARRFALAL